MQYIISVCVLIFLNPISYFILIYFFIIYFDFNIYNSAYQLIAPTLDQPGLRS